MGPPQWHCSQPMNNKLSELSQLGHLLLPAHRGKLEVIDSSINRLTLHTWGTPDWKPYIFISLRQTAAVQMAHFPIVIRMIFGKTKVKKYFT